MPVKLGNEIPGTLANNKACARHLILISMGLALDGANRFKITAFENAATSVMLYPHDVKEAAGFVGGIKAIGGIGDSTAAVILEWVKTGTSARYEELAKKHPMEALTMTIVDGIGPKGALKLYEAGIKNFDMLVAAAREGKLPDKQKEAVLFAVEKVRVPHEEAKALAQAVIGCLKATTKLTKFEPAGSLRRKTADSKDVDIVSCTDSTTDRDDALDVFSKLGQFIQRGENRASIRFTRNGRTMQVDLWIVPVESWGSALNYATGSKNHNVHLRMLAGKAGMTVNEYGIFKLEGDKAGERLGGADEHDLYRLLGIPYVEPQDRT
jgi:DNA polymerase (family X)